MKKALSKMGQSTLEYVIVLTAIVAAILFAATQFIKPSVNKVYSDAGATINGSSNLLVSQVGGGLNITATPGGGAPGGGTPAGGAPGGAAV